jgi:hypothetical protein
MPQLIGTAPSQIPTNGHLGSAAFMDANAFYGTGTTSSFRNIVINGAMEIAQRGTSVTGLMSGNSSYYTLDRFMIQNGGSGTFRTSFEQVSDAPSGFNKSAKITVTTPLSGALSATSYCGLLYQPEGYDVARLGWGTSAAKPLTISFWVKSSVVGRYIHVGIRMDTAGGTYSCFANIDINVANTWEYKTVTIPGFTTSTLTNLTNGSALQIHFNTFAGVSGLGTTSSLVWQQINALGTNEFVNDTRWIGTNGSTFQITGVQAEVGSVATPFEYRPFGMELAMCQRYYEKSFEYGTAPANGANGTSFATTNGIAFILNPHRGQYNSSSGNGYGGRNHYRYKVQKRATPSMSIYGNSNGNPYKHGGNGSAWITASYGTSQTADGFEFQNEYDGGCTFYNSIVEFHWTASAEL